MIGTLSFDDIVKKARGRFELGPEHHVRLLEMAVDGYKVIFRSALPIKRTLLTYMDDIVRRTVMFPSDMDDWFKVGMRVNNGVGNTLLTLSRNRNLIPEPATSSCACDCEPATTVEGVLTQIESGVVPYTDMFSFGTGWRDGQYVGEFYGMGGGLSIAGSFNVDYENNRFIFGTDVPTDREIGIQYRPSALEIDGQKTKVPDVALEAMIAWLNWKKKNDRNSSQSAMDAAGYAFDGELKDLHKKIHKIRKEEFLDLLYENLYFGVKR